MKFNSYEIKAIIATAKRLVRGVKTANNRVLSIKDEIRSAANRRADDISNKNVVGEIPDYLIEDLRYEQDNLREEECALAKFELLNGPAERWIERGWILLAQALLEENKYSEAEELAKDLYSQGRKSEALSVSKGLSKKGAPSAWLTRLLSH